VAHLPKIRFAGEVTDFKRLARLMREHVDHLMDLTQHLEQLTYHLTWSPSQLAPSGEISAPSLDTTELLEQTFAMVARHHPQTTDPAHSTNDELTFVIAHRSMEAWFAFVAAALQQAILCLSDDPSAEQLGWAIDCLMNCTEVIALFQGMIGVPKTFTPADYFLFRHQLAGGSGKYSSQFRLIELRLGRRGPDYLWRIEDVLTNQVRAALEQPSLATCITRLLEARGIFAPEATATERAKAIAEQIYLPTEADTPHADLRELLETAVALEEAWNLYGFRHLAMVERMTGKQGSMIAPPAPQEAAPTHGTEPPVHRHSKPYLLDALSAGSIFADAWAARTYVTRRPAVPPVRVG
jgi:tryptophan 2,3-dioxygenase